jgi:hypothetical protein
MLGRDEVIWGYRLILGREPECEESIAFHQHHENLAQLRKTLLGSDEFIQLFPRTGNVVQHVIFPDWRAVAEPRVVFMHCPKTGGTTLHHLLLSAFTEQEVCPERFNGLKNHPVGSLVQYRFFSGHYDLVSCQLIPGEKRIITFLREPVARLISLYNFLRAHHPDVVNRNDWELARLAAQLEAEEFFSHLAVRSHPYINNGMTRALVDTLPIEVWPVVDPSVVLSDISGMCDTAIERLKGMTGFGLLERYEESVELIFTALGVPRPATIERKMVLEDLVERPGNYRAVEKAQDTAAVRAVVAELVSEDCALYQAAQAIFEQRLTVLGRL